MKRKIIVVLVLGYGITIAILVGIWHPWQMKKDLNIIQVPIVKEDLPMRSLIQKEDIIYFDLPQALIHDDVLLDEQAILGKWTTHEMILKKGSFFYQENLNKEENLQDEPTLMLKKGQVAYPIPVDLKQIAGNTYVKNQKIDLYGIIQPRNEKPIIDLILQSVRILALKDRKGLEINDPNSTGVASIVVIALNQEYVAFVESLQLLGQIQIVATKDSWSQKEECLYQSGHQLESYLSSPFVEK